MKSPVVQQMSTPCSDFRLHLTLKEALVQAAMSLQALRQWNVLSVAGRNRSYLDVPLHQLGGVE